MKDPCDNPCIDGYYDKKNKINVICITRGYNDPPIDRSHCKPGKTTSSGWSGSSSWKLFDPYQYDPGGRDRVKSVQKLTKFQPYTRPEFVPYTQSSQPFIEPDRPYAPPKKIDPVIVNKKHIDKSVDF
ncbi:MAG: hypothetical protein LN545_04855 [Candidatus Megaira endosymbiont of Carteria cerasiformis]|nr:hypothetical protein [Candidatus Megaera polyxenophila]MCC8461300.1 hypothetical protein [Candidatus Megaera polyxenophila]